jgi:hypothetical protein
MSIVTVATSTTPSHPSVPAERPDLEFDRRWAAWKARGIAHERTVRRRAIVAIVAGAVTSCGVIAYLFLAS